MSIFYINKIFLAGNCSNEPELRYTAGGTALINFSIATNRSVKDGDNWKEIPTFHNIVLYGKLAESLAQKIKKGDQIMVEGRIDNRSWEHEGKKYYRTEVIADKVLTGRQSTKDKAAAPKTKKSEPTPPPQEPTGEEVKVEDIPF